MSKSRILNFTGGEVAPSFYNAVDLEKFQRSLMTLQNYIIHRSGGALNRLGDEHLDEVKDSNEEVRLIPFTASNKTTYTLELNAGAIRFIKNGQYLRDDEGNPYEVLIEYIDNLNELNYVQSADVMTIVHESHLIKRLKKINELDWRVEELKDVPKATPPRIRSRQFSPYWSDLLDKQSSNYKSKTRSKKRWEEARDIRYRSSDPASDFYSWLFKWDRYVKSSGVYVRWHGSFDIRFKRGLYRDMGVVGQGGRPIYINGDFRFDRPYNNIRRSNGDPVFDVREGPNLPTTFSNVHTVKYYIVSINENNQHSNHLVLDRRYTTGRGPTSSNPFYVVWGEPFTKPVGYAVFKQIDNGAIGLIGASTNIDKDVASEYKSSTIQSYSSSGLDFLPVISNSFKGATSGYWLFNSIGPRDEELIFKDTGIEPLTSYSLQERIESFNPRTVKPSATGIYQQRQYYGNGGEKLSENIWASRVDSSYDNFQVSSLNSVDPADALDFIIDSNQFNPIRHMTDLDGLIVQTDIGAFKISGGQDGKITPLTINSQKISGYGIQENLAPLEVGKELIFVQNYDSIVRVLDPRREETKDDDLTKFASHLFDGYKIVDWAVQLVPNQNIYAVREDGKMLCLTYAPLDEIRGWSVFDFIDSKVGTCCVTPEQDEDGNNILSLYINKEIMVNGVKKKYTSRIKPRHIKLRDDMHFMDSYKVIKAYPNYLIDLKTGDRSQIDKSGNELMYLEFFKVKDEDDYYLALSARNCFPLTKDIFSIHYNVLDDDGEEKEINILFKPFDDTDGDSLNYRRINHVFYRKKIIEPSDDPNLIIAIFVLGGLINKKVKNITLNQKINIKDVNVSRRSTADKIEFIGDNEWYYESVFKSFIDGNNSNKSSDDDNFIKYVYLETITKNSVFVNYSLRFLNEN